MRARTRAVSRVTLTINRTPASRAIAVEVVALVAAANLDHRSAARLARAFASGLRLLRETFPEGAGSGEITCRIDSQPGEVKILIGSTGKLSDGASGAPTGESIARLGRGLSEARWKSGPRERGLLIAQTAGGPDVS